MHLETHPPSKSGNFLIPSGNDDTSDTNEIRIKGFCPYNSLPFLGVSSSLYVDSSISCYSLCPAFG
jgi:hypothetical protein